MYKYAFCVCGISLYLLVASPACALELTIDEVIENVRTNELLYDNIDLRVDHEYSSGMSTQIQKDPTDDDALRIFNLQKAEIHYVGQNGSFRVDRQGSASASGEQNSLDRIRAFNGKSTRLLDQKVIGNVIDSRSEDENVIRPHMLLLRRMQFFVPLSTYLSGHKAMASHPGGQWTSNYTIETKYVGVDDFEGIKCHKVWITTLTGATGNQKPNDRWELWLSEQHNFIPARIFGYTFRTSDTEPVGEGKVKSWKEVEPGVWYPMSTEFIALDQRELKSTGTKRTQWADRLVTSEVSLHPEYPESYFSDVPFPDGTAVYSIKQGKVQDSIIQGAPAAMAVTDSNSRWWAMPVAISAAILLASVVLIRLASRLRR